MALLGCTEPRVFTPPLRELTPESSLGFAAVEFAEQVCGVTLYPYQRWLLIHALEIVGDLGGSWHFRFRKLVILVARQNGKSTLSQILSLFFLYVLRVDLVIGTAQDLDVAEDIWAGAVDIAEETPELAEDIVQLVKVNGKKALVLSGKRKYKVKAANRRAGRGLSGDLIMLDELREHQHWAAWSAITNTSMARPNAVILCLSNAGDSSSVVLKYLRLVAHRALGDPDGVNAATDPASLLTGEASEEGESDDSLGLFEWSAPPGAGVWDRDGWAQANPALGYGYVTERSLASAAASTPEPEFRVENLCQWVDGLIAGPFPPGAWDAGVVDASSQIVGEVVACVEVSDDRGRAAVVLAGRRADGKPQGEVVAYVSSAKAALEWLTSPERAVRPSSVVVRTGGQARTLAADLVAAGLVVREWKSDDVAQACGSLYDLVRGDDGGTGADLRHTSHPALDAAAESAPTRRVGDRWVWDSSKALADISCLWALTGAVWGLLHQSESAAPEPFLASSRLVVI